MTRGIIALLFIIPILIAGCSNKGSSDSGVVTDPAKDICLSAYVTLHGGLKDAYDASEEGLTKAVWGTRHYEVYGADAGNDLPRMAASCAPYILNDDACWVGYVDRFPDLIADFNLNYPQGTPADKLAYGKNHYYAFGASVIRRFDSECSNIWTKSQPVFDDPGPDPTIPTVSLSCSASSISEAAGQTSTCVVTASAKSTKAISVSFGFSGTATPDADYTGKLEDITIAAGALNASWVITSIADTIAESNETVIINITAVTNATEKGMQKASLTITDGSSNSTVSFACAPLSITEANQTSTCTMSLSSASSTNVVVSFAYTGSSLPTDDYTGIKTSVTIAKGATSTTWGITAIPDSVVEGEESVIMNITTVTGGTELGTQAVTLTIRNTTESTPDPEPEPEPEPEPDPTCAEAGSPWTDCEVGDEMFSGLYIWYSYGGTHYAMYLNPSSLAYGSVMNHNAYSSNGQTNTTSILSAEAAAPAAKYCNDLSNDLGSDWWMPTAGHIRTMAINGLVATSIEVWSSKQNGAHATDGVTLSYDSGDISSGSSWGSNPGIAKTATHRVICATIISG